MNREDPYRDQAERLRKKIDKAPELGDNKIQKEELPPRSRHHRERRKKNKWKLKHPVISLLALFFILLPITIFSMYKYWELEKIKNAEKAATSGNSFEMVGFENQEESKGTSIEEQEVEKDSNSPDENESEKEDSEASIHETPVVDSSTNQDGLISDKDKGDDKPKEQPEQKKPEDEKTDLVVYHTVKPNETMYRIAMNYYKSPSGIEIIKKANNLKNENIQAGQVLVIPNR